MIFPGDHKHKYARRNAFKPKYILAEYLGGVKSNIPRCCAIYYVIVTRLYLIIGSMKVLELFYPDGWEFFQEKDYHRCYVCHLHNKIAKVEWNGITEWTMLKKLGGI